MNALNKWSNTNRYFLLFLAVLCARALYNVCTHSEFPKLLLVLIVVYLQSAPDRKTILSFKRGILVSTVAAIAWIIYRRNRQSRVSVIIFCLYRGSA